MQATWSVLGILLFSCTAGKAGITCSCRGSCYPDAPQRGLSYSAYTTKQLETRSSSDIAETCCLGLGLPCRSNMPCLQSENMG
mmetsp:Transcript_4839/g.11374  ORF Transcript_4839/g.11374 Transcript_4839/m.11374 type:complete len:83 (+) Transcript_4839:121-369(+)